MERKSSRQKGAGLSRPVRAIQGLETWARVLRMRDELVVERKQVGVDKDGNPIGERFQSNSVRRLAVSRGLASESCAHYHGNGDGLSYN
ncbi:MAG: hypothetical protein ACTHMB_07145 [Candidatus Binatia bacterium]